MVVVLSVLLGLSLTACKKSEETKTVSTSSVEQRSVGSGQASSGSEQSAAPPADQGRPASAASPEKAARLAGEQPFQAVLFVVPEPGKPIQPESLRLRGDALRELERLGFVKLEQSGKDTLFQVTDQWPAAFRPSAAKSWDKNVKFEVGRFQPDGKKYALVPGSGPRRVVQVSGTFTYSPWAQGTPLVTSVTRRLLKGGTMNYEVVRRGEVWVFDALQTPNVH